MSTDRKAAITRQTGSVGSTVIQGRLEWLSAPMLTDYGTL
jgi:hypothetical protein